VMPVRKRIETISQY